MNYLYSPEWQAKYAALRGEWLAKQQETAVTAVTDTTTAATPASPPPVDPILEADADTVAALRARLAEAEARFEADRNKGVVAHVAASNEVAVAQVAVAAAVVEAVPDVAPAPVVSEPVTAVASVVAEPTVVPTPEPAVVEPAATAVTPAPTAEPAPAPEPVAAAPVVPAPAPAAEPVAAAPVAAPAPAPVVATHVAYRTGRLIDTAQKRFDFARATNVAIQAAEVIVFAKPLDPEDAKLMETAPAAHLAAMIEKYGEHSRSTRV